MGRRQAAAAVPPPHSPRTGRCSTSLGFPGRCCCARSPQSPAWNPCLQGGTVATTGARGQMGAREGWQAHTPAAHAPAWPAWRWSGLAAAAGGRCKVGAGCMALHARWGALPAAPAEVRMMSYPPGCSSRKSVTSYTCTRVQRPAPWARWRDLGGARRTRPRAQTRPAPSPGRARGRAAHLAVHNQPAVLVANVLLALLQLERLAAVRIRRHGGQTGLIPGCCCAHLDPRHPQAGPARPG